MIASARRRLETGTRIEREFDPAAVRELKGSAESDLLIGGAELAASAFFVRYRTEP